MLLFGGLWSIATNNRVSSINLCKMVIRWKIKGFENYGVTAKGEVVRLKYVTNHHHYKSERVIKCNSRNQFRLYRNSKLETWSKRQLRRLLIPTN